MTEEQIQELKELDLPYCPSSFEYVGGHFKKYKAYMSLLSFRSLGFDGSANLEADLGDFWRRHRI